MKKLFLTFIFILFTISLTGCFSKVKLEEDQSHLTIYKDGEIKLVAIVSEDTADDVYDVDIEDKKKDVEKDILDYFDDNHIDVEIDKLRIKKDTIEVTLTLEDSKDLDIRMKDTLEDYAKDWGYKDVEALSEYQDFILYKDDEEIKSKDLEDYEDYAILNLSGENDGCYYTIPGEIILVSDMDYERINKEIIYIDDGEYGIVVYK